MCYDTLFRYLVLTTSCVKNKKNSKFKRENNANIPIYKKKKSVLKLLKNVYYKNKVKLYTDYKSIRNKK